MFALQLTNVISLAAGEAHGVVALDSGSVTNWGSYWTGTNFVSVTAPPLLTNATAVAAGSRHDLALKTDGTMVAWGLNDFGQTNVPANATNIVAIAAGGQQSLALLKNRTVMQWGKPNGPVPAGLTNVTTIAAGTNFCLAACEQCDCEVCRCRWRFSCTCLAAKRWDDSFMGWDNTYGGNKRASQS